MKILYVTTIGKTMGFFKAFIKNLVDNGHTVDIATNENGSPVPECYREWGCEVYPISTSRSPLNKGNVMAIKQLRKLVKENGYDIVHCHTPNAAVVTRLACRKLRKKRGLKVFYTAHGFHFYKGAPLLNWLVFYPVEKLCARFTDVLITINQEDYALAKKKMKAKRVEYVAGVGVDLSRFDNVEVDREAKRREIGVPEDAFLLISVGELNENKNHQVIIKAMAKLNNPKVHYAIAGKGEKSEFLIELAKKLGVSEQLHLLGYRRDIPELNASADVFCFPSLREGLPVAPIEAMACGLPTIVSSVRGIDDCSENGVTGYKCSSHDVDGFAESISKLVTDQDVRKKMSEQNKKVVERYSINEILPRMKSIYES